MKPQRFTKAQMSASDTVRARVSYAGADLMLLERESVGTHGVLSVRVSVQASPEIGAAHFGIAGELGGGPLQGDPARLEHVGAPRDGQRHRRVLLHQEDGHALPVDGLHGLEDLLDEHGGEAHGGLVEQEQPRARHEGAADGEHLLLAARQRARHLHPPLLEAREGGEDALHVLGDPAIGAGVGPHLQVLEHGQAIEDAPPLGHMGDPAEHDVVGGDAEEGFALEAHVATAGGEEPRQGLEGGGLAGAVVAEEGHDLALGDPERDALERVDLPVEDVEVLHLQHGVSHRRPPRAPTCFRPR